jgi:hypothetical protein
MAARWWEERGVASSPDELGRHGREGGAETVSSLLIPTPTSFTNKNHHIFIVAHNLAISSTK